MLFISKLDGKLSCSEHDPCGPDPLEPGEIREFAPVPNSIKPRTTTSAPHKSMAVPSLKRAMTTTSSASAPSFKPTVPSKHEPPPRLYINTKTATSSFVPSSKTYLTDRTEEKSFSNSPPSRHKEAGEVEDGEVCSIEVEEIEEDEDDDDDDEDDDDEDDSEDEVEIVMDEGDEPVFGSDLEPSEGADQFHAWADEDNEEDDVEEDEEVEVWDTDDEAHS